MALNIMQTEINCKLDGAKHYANRN